MNDCNFCQSVREWFKKPFRENGNVWDWFLFLGLTVIAAWLWTRILERIIR